MSNEATGVIISREWLLPLRDLIWLDFLLLLSYHYLHPIPISISTITDVQLEMMSNNKTMEGRKEGREKRTTTTNNNNTSTKGGEKAGLVVNQLTASPNPTRLGKEERKSRLENHQSHW